jgi:hypothetical protein
MDQSAVAFEYNHILRNLNVLCGERICSLLAVLAGGDHFAALLFALGFGVLLIAFSLTPTAIDSLTFGLLGFLCRLLVRESQWRNHNQSDKRKPDHYLLHEKPPPICLDRN